MISQKRLLILLVFIVIMICITMIFYVSDPNAQDTDVQQFASVEEAVTWLESRGLPSGKLQSLLQIRFDR